MGRPALTRKTLAFVLAPKTRKDVAQVFSGLLRRSTDSAQPCIDYLLKHTEILSGLIDGCAAVS